ncbi:MAG: DUF1801 domain-containing protein [bacterium]
MAAKKTAKARKPKASAKQAKRTAAPKGKSARADRPVAAKAEGEGPVRAYIAVLPAWQRAIALQVDAIVTEEVPHARRAIKWHTPFYGVEGKGWFLSTGGFSKHFKVLFFNGTSLKPVPPVGESGKTRALDLREGDAFDEAKITSWIKQAASKPGWGSS